MPEDHLAWFLIEAVAEMDTSAFHAGRVRAGQGRAGYDPDMMVTLLLYAYAHKVHSSRQIERPCTVDVAFRVICAQDVPDHSTIARFRAEHEAASKDRMRSPATWPTDRRIVGISADSLSDPGRGVRSRGERRPEEGRRDRE